MVTTHPSGTGHTSNAWWPQGAGGSSRVHLEVGHLAPQHSGRGVQGQMWAGLGAECGS